MAELRKRRYNVAFNGDSVEVMPVERTDMMLKGNENEEHRKKQRKGVKEMPRLHQREQYPKRRILCLFLIILGLYSCLYCINFSFSILL